MFHHIIIVALILGIGSDPAQAQQTEASGSAHADEEWPRALPLAITASPDWTDYRIYPAEARRFEQEGEVAVQLLIARDGMPRRCHVLQGSGFSALDNGTCGLALQMRFAPPLGDNGEAIESSHRLRILWRLAPRPLRFEASSLVARLTLEGGQVSSCNLEGTGPLLGFWSQFACRDFAKQAPYFLGKERDSISAALIQVEMTPNGNSPAGAPAPLARRVASRTIEFELNRKGEATNCRTMRDAGFGTPVDHHTAPCSLFLHRALQFRKDPSIKRPRRGSLHINVYELASSPRSYKQASTFRE